MEHLIAMVMGLVEGITEFLPVSSTGHLILAGHLLGFEDETAKTFEVFIQLGAILAVVLAYRATFAELFSAPSGEGFRGRNGIVLLLVTTLPGLVGGKLAHSFIKEHLFNPTTVAVGLAVGAVWILLTERFYRHHAPRSLDELTWKRALAIGCFQCLALWPGMSRSTSTILGGMLVGLTRKAATEYSFFAAVPMLAAACGYDLLHNADLLTSETIPYFLTGFVVSFLSAWAAIRLFIRFVSRHSLSVFAWYRLALAAMVFAWLS
jgi:undecaprenyl-diphosphatase